LVNFATQSSNTKFTFWN